MLQVFQEIDDFLSSSLVASVPIKCPRVRWKQREAQQVIFWLLQILCLNKDTHLLTAARVRNLLTAASVQNLLTAASTRDLSFSRIRPLVRLTQSKLNNLILHWCTKTTDLWAFKSWPTHFFAVLLSPVLDGFEWLLSLGTVYLFLSSAAVIESQWNQIFPWKKFGNTGNQTRAAGVRSLNAWPTHYSWILNLNLASLRPVANAMKHLLIRFTNFVTWVKFSKSPLANIEVKFNHILLFAKVLNIFQ